jgi:hypothetical protein
MSSRRMSLLPRATLHSDSEQLLTNIKPILTDISCCYVTVDSATPASQNRFSCSVLSVLLHNGRFCNACITKQYIIQRCIPKQIMWLNVAVT